MFIDSPFAGVILSLWKGISMMYIVIFFLLLLISCIFFQASIYILAFFLLLLIVYVCLQIWARVTPVESRRQRAARKNYVPPQGPPGYVTIPYRPGARLPRGTIYGLTRWPKVPSRWHPQQEPGCWGCDGRGWLLYARSLDLDTEIVVEEQCEKCDGTGSEAYARQKGQLWEREQRAKARQMAWEEAERWAAMKRKCRYCYGSGRIMSPGSGAMKSCSCGSGR